MFQIQKIKNLKTKCFSKGSAILLSATLCPWLTGCMGVYEGGFECPPGEGVGCKSISEVNHMVDQLSVPGLQSSGQYSVPSVQCSEEQTGRSEIWYAPLFEKEQKTTCKTKVLDALSI